MSNPGSLDSSSSSSSDDDSISDKLEVSSESETINVSISSEKEEGNELIESVAEDNDVQISNLKPLSSSTSIKDNNTIPEESIENKTENILICSPVQEENTLKESSTKNIDDQNYLTLALKDIQDKLSDILIENIKLKDILKQKDNALRKQFNTVVIFEKEVVEICENYKTRFCEVKNLVDYYKQEKEKVNVNGIIESNEEQNFSTNFYLSDEESCTMVSSLPSTSKVGVIDELAVTQSSALKLKLHPNGYVEDLLKKMEEMTINYTQVQLKLKEVEKQRETDLEQFNEQLEKFQNELEVLKQKLTLPDKFKLLRLIKEDYKTELERKYIVEVIKLLEQKIQISHINCEKQAGNTVQDVDSHYEKWQEFIECFIKQCIQNTDLETFQAECKNILQTFKNAQLSCDHIFIEEVTDKKKNPICDYRKILINEQLQCIKDERTTLNVRRQFFKAFADYNKVVTQLEILKRENLRLTEVNGVTFNHHNFAEIEKCLIEEKKIFDIEKEKMSEERLSIEKEKQSIKEEWECLSAERVVLLEEKDQLLEEGRRLELKDSQLKQKTDANHEQNNIELNNKLRETTAELENVKEELQNTHETITNLRAELSELDNQKNEVFAYKLQAEMQENEFVAMREAERNYLQQIENLSTTIHELREENQQLVNRNNLPNENEV